MENAQWGEYLCTVNGVFQAQRVRFANTSGILEYVIISQPINKQHHTTLGADDNRTVSHILKGLWFLNANEAINVSIKRDRVQPFRQYHQCSHVAVAETSQTPWHRAWIMHAKHVNKRIIDSDSECPIRDAQVLGPAGQDNGVHQCD